MATDPGKLKDRVRRLVASTAGNDYGEDVETFAPADPAAWWHAAVWPLGANEVLDGKQMRERDTFRIRVRYKAELSTTDRLDVKVAEREFVVEIAAITYDDDKRWSTIVAFEVAP